MIGIRFRDAHRAKRGPALALRAVAVGAAFFAAATGCTPPPTGIDHIFGTHGAAQFSIIANLPSVEKVTTTKWLEQGGYTRLVAQGTQLVLGQAALASIWTSSPNQHLNGTTSFGPGQAPFVITIRVQNQATGLESVCVVGDYFNQGGYSSPGASGTVTAGITAIGTTTGNSVGQGVGSGSGNWSSVTATGSIVVNNCDTYTHAIGSPNLTTSVENWDVNFSGTAV